MSAYTVALTVLMAAQGHYAHACAHKIPQSKNPMVVRILQDLNVIQNYKRHQPHHSNLKHDTHFCALSGHMNGVLDSMLTLGKRMFLKNEDLETKPEKKD
jgi:hypothetical protein